MYCQKCGNENGEANAFCAACGAPLNAVAQPGIKKKDNLDVISFLSTSTEYHKMKKKLTTIPGIIMAIVGVVLSVFLFYGYSSWNSSALKVSFVFILIELFVLLPIMIVGSVKLDKYGKQLYREYLDNQ